MRNEIDMITDCNLLNVLIECLYETNSVKVNFSEPFTLSSGIKSPIYVDTMTLMSSRHAHYASTNLIAQVGLDEKSRDGNTVVSVCPGGIPWGQTLAFSKAWNSLFCYKTPKTYGLKNQLEGELCDDARIVIVDDTITTGSAVLAVIDAIKREGKPDSEVLSVFTMIDWDFKEVNEMFISKGIEKHHLLTMMDIIEYGHKYGPTDEKNYLTDEEYTKLVDFMTESHK